jgi:hypothetical protein
VLRLEIAESGTCSGVDRRTGSPRICALGPVP